MAGVPVRHEGTTLLILLLAYAAASLLHYAHNAEFLAEYPNMPTWLSRSRVYAAWIGVTAIGAVGYFLFCSGYRFAGLGAIAVYAALGFDGFAHYGLAPLSAHTATMHLTIWLEAATATLVLVAAAGIAAKQPRPPATQGQRPDLAEPPAR